MSGLQQIDLWYVAGHAAIVAGLVSAPALCWALLARRRLALLSAVGGCALLWTLAFLAAILDADQWRNGPVPVKRLAVLRACPDWIFRWGIPVAYCAIAPFWTMLLLGATEVIHEDTIFAPGFSRSAWSRVAEGMSERQVLQILGPPLPDNVQPFFVYHLPQSTRSRCWATNWSAGYFACLWFSDGRTTEKRLWYDN